MNATETRYANLMKLTVADLKGIADRMATPYSSRIKKADLVNAIMVDIELAHTRAIEDEEWRVEEDEFMFAGVLWSGKIAKMLRFNDTAVKRYNPTAKRGKDGVVILTARQKRRINKKARHFGKTIGFWEVSA